jgi:heme-degrading monooxygenase HmoA
MIVTVFRSRLRPEAAATYAEAAPRMSALAVTMPGYLSHKVFIAEDGERLTLVEHESEEALRAWSVDPDHIQAKKMGRREYYAEYAVQVCKVIRESRFKRDEAAPRG